MCSERLTLRLYYQVKPFYAVLDLTRKQKYNERQGVCRKAMNCEEQNRLEGGVVQKNHAVEDTSKSSWTNKVVEIVAGQSQMGKVRNGEKRKNVYKQVFR